MKYNININQKALIKLTPEITLSEAAVLEDVIALCNSKSKKMKRMEINGELCTWISPQGIIKDLPLLHVRSEKSIQRALRKLNEFDYIDRYCDRKPSEVKGHIESRIYVNLTSKVDLLRYEKKDIERFENNNKNEKNVKK